MMSEKDFLKDIVGEPARPEKNNEERQQEVIKKIRRSENQGDFLEFGLIKIWVVVLEFFSQLQASAQKREELIKKEDGDKNGV